MSASPSKELVHKALDKINQFFVNALISRADFQGTGLESPRRNLAKEVGYPEYDPTLWDYWQMYKRVGIGNRVVSILSDECFANRPEVTEQEGDNKTPFEDWLVDFEEEKDPYSELQRVDELSGLGHYGVLLIGVNDGKTLDQPVDGINLKTGEIDLSYKGSPRKVTFLRSFPELCAKINEVETDDTSPRLGQVNSYQIYMANLDESPEAAPDVENDGKIVHWTRCLHVVDNRLSSLTSGMPRLEKVYDNVLDIRKISASAPEMFYKGAFPGISFEALPELVASAELETETLKKEIEAYSNGLQRYLRLVGMTAKSLAPQIADPTNQLMSIIQLICAAIKTPFRVFMGSEQGHMAGEQDGINWRGRIRGRNNQYLSPYLIKPFYQRLQLLRAAPPSKRIRVKWPDLNTISDTDKAKVALQKAQALLQYVTSGSKVMMPPKMFFMYVMNFTEAEAMAIIDAAGGEAKMVKEMQTMVDAQAGNTPATTGTNPASSTGAGGRRNGLGKGPVKKKKV